MSRFKKPSILKVYNKNEKKSIFDLILLIIIIAIILTPIIINIVARIEVEARQVNLSLSTRFVELFGSEMTEDLLREFRELNPDIRIQTNDAAADILIFNEGELGVSLSAIPLVSFMDMLFYNIDILTAADFDRPPKTRDEFSTYAAAVSGNSGAALSLSAEDRQALARDVFSWIWAAGENIGLPSNNRASAAALDFFAALDKNNALAPFVFETTGEQRVKEFAEGKIAMMIASTDTIPFLREKMGDSAFGITTIPNTGGAGKYSVRLSSIYADINPECEHPEEAQSFLSFLAEKNPLFCAQLKAVPGMVFNPIPGDYVRDDPFYSKAWDIFESSEIVEGLSASPDAEEYERVFFEELQKRFTQP